MMRRVLIGVLIVLALFDLSGCKTKTPSGLPSGAATTTGTQPPATPSPPASEQGKEVNWQLDLSNWSGKEDPFKLAARVDVLLNDADGWSQAGVKFIGNGGPDASMRIIFLTGADISNQNKGGCASGQEGCYRPGIDPDNPICVITLKIEVDGGGLAKLVGRSVFWHEWGHCVLGGTRVHSQDPNNVMYPTLTGGRMTNNKPSAGQLNTVRQRVTAGSNLYVWPGATGPVG